MPIIDAQVHAYERNSPERPWVGHLAGPDAVTGDDMVKAMDAVGVAGAIMVSPYAMYGYDASYAVAVHKAHPGRFALVKPVDPKDPGVADVIGAWKATPGTVAVRIMMVGDCTTDPADPGLNRVLAGAKQHGLPVNILCWGRLDQMDALAARNPGTRIVIDHLGLLQPFAPPAPPDPFGDLPKLLRLARFDNVVVKISGACTLSHQPFPYADIWDPVMRIIETFGLERCLWGTDWTRATALLTYKQGVDAFLQSPRLSDGDRAVLMGGALTKVYGWSPTPP